MPKISELNAVESLNNNDLLAVAYDVGGLPSTKKITISNFANTITNSLRYANTTAGGVVKVGSGLYIYEGVLNSNNLLTLPTSNTNEGYILTWDHPTNTAIWQALAPVYDYKVIDSANTYVVQEHDSVIFVKPNSISEDITIILPIADAVEGKEYYIKNVDNGGQYKVRVTTQDGLDNGSNYIEDPVTGNFVVYYDLISKGDGDAWIHDGTVWRNTISQRAVPVFYTDVNTYAQVAVKNASAANNASADLVLYNNLGEIESDAGPYIDIGINSSTYNEPDYNIGGASDGYIYNKGGDLTIGTANTGTSVIIHADGTTSDKAKLIANSSAVFANTDFIPTQNNVFNLGSVSKQWKSLYVSNNTIYIGGIPVTVNASGILTVNGSVSVGYTGSTGAQGNIGYSGSVGTQGVEGYTGSTGIQGNAGYTGSSGNIKSLTTISVVGPTVITSDITFADPNAAGANVNLVFPSSPTSGKVYTVKNINAGGSVVYVQTDGTDGMENESGSIGTGVYATISSSGGYLTWVYDGSSSTYRRIG